MGLADQARLLHINATMSEINSEIEWKVSPALVDYEEATAFMDERVAKIREGTASECIWFLEHAPLYTAGTSARREDLLSPDRFPVYDVGRGGQYTYHGPGQRVAYVMLDLKRRNPDVRWYVQALENWVKLALMEFNVKGEQREGRVGLWVERGDGYEDKIAAIGVRLRKWVTFHGIAINVEPDLSHFDGIVPCGIGEEKFGVTSLVDLGLPVTMDDLDIALEKTFAEAFQNKSL